MIDAVKAIEVLLSLGAEKEVNFEFLATGFTATEAVGLLSSRSPFNFGVSRLGEI